MNTELAFAYNRGAHDGVLRSISRGYMTRCEMVWTTAGAIRTCPRCLEINGKVVGYTDEVGVQLPPLHPRCRCAIVYRETSNKPGRGFEFDIQRFVNYEEQVKSHGGSGRIKPDRVIDSHGGIPRKGEPLSIIDHKNSFTGIIDKRAFFDENGNIYLEIHTTNHGNAKNHPYGKTGEHAHDITFKQGEKPKSYARELSEKERKDNGDIL